MIPRNNAFLPRETVRFTGVLLSGMVNPTVMFAPTRYDEGTMNYAAFMRSFKVLSLAARSHNAQWRTSFPPPLPLGSRCVHSHPGMGESRRLCTHPKWIVSESPAAVVVSCLGRTTDGGAQPAAYYRLSDPANAVTAVDQSGHRRDGAYNLQFQFQFVRPTSVSFSNVACCITPS